MSEQEPTGPMQPIDREALQADDLTDQEVAAIRDSQRDPDTPPPDDPDVG